MPDDGLLAVDYFIWDELQLEYDRLATVGGGGSSTAGRATADSDAPSIEAPPVRA